MKACLLYTSDEPGDELRVATGETLLAYKMPPVLQRFKQRAPKVRLSLQSLNCYSIRDALLADEVDLGVFYRVGNDDALTMMELGPQPLALVASVDQAPVDFLRPRQHIPLSFIINEPQCVFRQIFESTLRQRGITMENTIEPVSYTHLSLCPASPSQTALFPDLREPRSPADGNARGRRGGRGRGYR